MSLLDRLPRVLRDRLERKRLAYVHTFMGPQGLTPSAEIVLADLKRFCGISRGGLKISPITRMTDPYGSAYLAGQRDVFQRITEFLRLDGADIHEDNQR